MQTDIVTSFTGEHRFLSNFWRVLILYGGNTYPTVEHAYQATKIEPTNMRYYEMCRDIRNAPTPGRAKRLGRNVPLRAGWHNEKLRVMEMLVTRKFEHPDLAKKLIATAPATLIEGNNWCDRYWGICEGYGENHLGRILMEVRERLIQQA